MCSATQLVALSMISSSCDAMGMFRSSGGGRCGGPAERRQQDGVDGNVRDRQDGLGPSKADHSASVSIWLSGLLRVEFNAAAAELGLPPSQALALANLSSPAPMRRLAEWLSCEASNVTGIV